MQSLMAAFEILHCLPEAASKMPHMTRIRLEGELACASLQTFDMVQAVLVPERNSAASSNSAAAASSSAASASAVPDAMTAALRSSLHLSGTAT